VLNTQLVRDFAVGLVHVCELLIHWLSTQETRQL